MDTSTREKKELSEGHIICYHCEGSGIDLNRNTGFRLPACKVCHGAGVIEVFEPAKEWLIMREYIHDERNY